ncbi:MAG: MmgE/PrpD family protein, partial [Haloferacaceae archaeon]
MAHGESERGAGETAALAAFVTETTAADVPESAFADARVAIRDYLGVAVYGAHHGVGERIAAHVDATMPGDGASVVARGRASPTGAALANGTFGHAVDYDDTFESIVIHPTSPVFAAALAAVEHADDANDA